MTVAVIESQGRPNITHFQGSLLVLLTGVVFSFGGLAFRSTDAISSWEYIFFRGVGAAAVTGAGLVLQHRGKLATVLGQVKPMHVLAGVLLGLTSCVFIVALEVTSVAFVLFLQTGAPIAAAYFSWLIMKERVSREVMLAAGGTMVGMGVMVSGTLTDAVAPAGLIAVFIPLSFGLYATLIRAAERIDPTIPVFASGMTMLGIGLGVSMATGGMTGSLNDALIGLFSGSVLLGLPLAVFNRAQRVVAAPETALLLLSEVVMAPLWVWIFVSEQPETTTLIGGAIILAAVAWLTVARRPGKGRVLTSRG